MNSNNQSAANQAVQRVRTRVMLVLLISLVVLLALILLSTEVGGTAGSRLITVALSVFAAVVVGAVDYLWLWPQVIRTYETLAESVRHAIYISDRTDRIGLVDVVRRPLEGESFTRDILLKSPNAYIAMHTGQTWVRSYRQYLQERFARPGTKTFFLLPHPQSDVIDALAAREYKDPETVRRLIEETMEALRDLATVGSQGQLNVYGHRLFPPWSAVVGDFKGSITIGHAGPSRTPSDPVRLVLAESGSGSYLSQVRQDIQDLMAADSTELMFKLPQDQ